MKPPSPALLLLLPACTAHVTHPTKSRTEMRADIDLCTREANHHYWMDPVAALLNAYDCLEAKGYRRGDGDVAAGVHRAMVAGNKEPATAQPCRVPCGKRH